MYLNSTLENLEPSSKDGFVESLVYSTRPSLEGLDGRYTEPNTVEDWRAQANSGWVRVGQDKETLLGRLIWTMNRSEGGWVVSEVELGYSKFR